MLHHAVARELSRRGRNRGWACSKIARHMTDYQSHPPYMPRSIRTSTPAAARMLGVARAYACKPTSAIGKSHWSHCYKPSRSPRRRRLNLMGIPHRPTLLSPKPRAWPPSWQDITYSVSALTGDYVCGGTLHGARLESIAVCTRAMPAARTVASIVAPNITNRYCTECCLCSHWSPGLRRHVLSRACTGSIAVCGRCQRPRITTYAR